MATIWVLPNSGLSYPRPQFLTENRSTTRHAVALDIAVTSSGSQSQQTTINLSLGGALIHYAERLPLGSRVDVVFRLPTAEQPIAVGATVRWTTDASIGIQFDGLRAHEVWSLNEYFKQFKG